VASFQPPRSRIAWYRCVVSLPEHSLGALWSLLIPGCGLSSSSSRGLRALDETAYYAPFRKSSKAR